MLNDKVVTHMYYPHFMFRAKITKSQFLRIFKIYKTKNNCTYEAAHLFPVTNKSLKPKLNIW